MDPSRKQAHINNVRGSKYTNPFGTYSGKVIAVNPDSSTVDIRMFNGDTLRRVRVLLNSANTVAGIRYLASIKNVRPHSTPRGTMDTGLLSKEQDTIAIVTFLDGNLKTPRVIGFDLPITSQLHVNEDGLYVLKHESGVYEIIDSSGTREVHYPDGSYLIFGQRNTPKDMTAVKGNGQAWSTPSASSIQAHIHLSQGVDITMVNGQVTMTCTKFTVNGTVLA